MDSCQGWTASSETGLNNMIAHDAKSLYEFFRNLKLTYAYFDSSNSFVDEWVLKTSALKNFVNSVDH